METEAQAAPSFHTNQIPGQDLDADDSNLCLKYLEPYHTDRDAAGEAVEGGPPSVAMDFGEADWEFRWDEALNSKTPRESLSAMHDPLYIEPNSCNRRPTKRVRVEQRELPGVWIYQQVTPQNARPLRRNHE